MKKIPYILLLEDDPFDADLSRRAIIKSKADLNVVWFEEGEQALLFLEENKDDLPALILMDLKMPKMGGTLAIREIRKRYPSTELNIAVFSSSELIEDKKACLQEGANDYFVKPTSLSEFRSVIKELLAKFNLLD